MAKPFHDVDQFGLDENKKQLIEYLTAVRLKGLIAEKEAWQAEAITVAREEPAQ